jgi:hypothetical protein
VVAPVLHKQNSKFKPHNWEFNVSQSTAPEQVKKLVISDYDLLEVDKVAIQLIYDKEENLYYAELVKLMIHHETDKSIAIVEPVNLTSSDKFALIRETATISYKLYGAETIDTALVLSYEEMNLIEKLSITEAMEEEQSFSIKEDTISENKTLH